MTYEICKNINYSCRLDSVFCLKHCYWFSDATECLWNRKQKRKSEPSIRSWTAHSFEPAEPSRVSMKSGESMDQPVKFHLGDISASLRLVQSFSFKVLHVIHTLLYQCTQSPIYEGPFINYRPYHWTCFVFS